MNVTNAVCRQVDCSNGTCGSYVSHIARTTCCNRITASCQAHARFVNEGVASRPNWFGFLSNPCVRCGGRGKHPVHCGFCGTEWRKRLRWVTV